MTDVEKTGADPLHCHLGILRRRCPHIRRALKEVGLPAPRRREPGFATLIRIIVDQQVSTAAGAAIWAKVHRVCHGEVTPRRLLRLGETGLRANGFSGQKARYALGIAEAVVDARLDLAALEEADDDTVRGVLTALKGVGAWTADIYLMFAMGRPDIWPAGDLGLQHGIRLLHERELRPSVKDMIALAEDWRPYRSGAAILLWHYYGSLRRKSAAPTA
jgi:DNA-3-methyladenine glycosylase II